MLAEDFQKIEHHILNHSRISMQTLFKLIKEDSLLIILFILSVLNIILAPLPANSFVLGIPLMLISAAYGLRIDLGAKPYKWLRRPVKCTRWRPFMAHAKPILMKVDRFVRPRYSNFVAPRFDFLAGLSLFILAAIIFLPIPFGNIPGSIGMILLIVGLLQKDGIFVLIGYFITIAHLIAVTHAGIWLISTL